VRTAGGSKNELSSPSDVKGDGGFGVGIEGGVHSGKGLRAETEKKKYPRFVECGPG